MIQEAECEVSVSVQCCSDDDQATGSQSLQSFLVRARTTCGNAGRCSHNARTLDDEVAVKVCPWLKLQGQASGTMAADLQRRRIGVPVRWSC